MRPRAIAFWLCLDDVHLYAMLPRGVINDIIPVGIAGVFSFQFSIMFLYMLANKV